MALIDHTPLKHGAFGHLPAKTCCKECPLSRTSKPGALGGYTASQYVEVLHGIADIACHMSKGFDAKQPDLQRSCTGVAMYRANVGVRNLARNAQAAKEAAGPNSEAVFASPSEFLEHHDPAAARLIDEAMKAGAMAARLIITTGG